MDEKLIKEINKIFHEIEAERYDERHPEIMEGDLKWWNDFGRRFVKPLSDSKNISILDIGSGTGFVANEIAKYLSERDTLFCYDLSAEMLAAARKKLNSVSSAAKKEFLSGDAELLPFKNSGFDVVTANAVLHHLPDYPSLLEEADRVLKKGGILAVAHELNSDFFKSKLFCCMASLYKLIGGGMKISGSEQAKVNEGLKKKNLIENDLSKGEIMGLVDCHSPIEQDSIAIDAGRGISPNKLIADYFPEYEILELEAYSTFFHRPFLEKNRFFQSAVKLCNNVFLRNRGTLFRFILRKPSEDAFHNTASNKRLREKHGHE